jgi:7-carboxy-7-deazaguanine synthase
MYAVDPLEVKKNRTIYTAADLAASVTTKMWKQTGSPIGMLVTLSGGNPAMWDLEDFVEGMHGAGSLVCIETQGTVYRPWIARCDLVNISPKGPGMGIDMDWDVFHKFWQQLWTDRGHLLNVTIKIPVFDERDLDFAAKVKCKLKGAPIPMVLSVGNYYGNSISKPPLDDLRHNLLENLISMTDAVLMLHPELYDCQILPQLHVLMYGNLKGK